MWQTHRVEAGRIRQTTLLNTESQSGWLNLAAASLGFSLIAIQAENQFFFVYIVAVLRPKVSNYELATCWGGTVEGGMN